MALLVKNGQGNERDSLFNCQNLKKNHLFLSEVVAFICEQRGLQFEEDFVQKWTIKQNGMRLRPGQKISLKQPLVILDLVFEEKVGLPGGKGGYGSLLRNAAKTKIHLNDQNSNRTLSGRRMRDTENEKKLMEWLRREKAQRETIRRMNEENEKSGKKNVQAKGKPNPRLSSEYAKKEDVVDSSSLSSSIMQGISERKKVKTDNPEPRVPIKRSSQKKERPEKPVFCLNLEEDKTELLGKRQSEVGVIEIKEKKTFEPLVFEKYRSLEEVRQVDPEHLKHELSRLGLKCGGTPEQRAERLWIVIQNPVSLSNPKLLVAPAKK